LSCTNSTSIPATANLRRWNDSMKNPRSSSNTCGSTTTTPSSPVGRNCMRDPLRQALAVLLLIVLAVFARLHALHPGAVSAVPVDRVSQPVAKGDLRLPTQFALRLAAVDGVPQVVTGTVRHVADQRPWFLKQLEQQVRDFQVC